MPVPNNLIEQRDHAACDNFSYVQRDRSLGAIKTRGLLAEQLRSCAMIITEPNEFVARPGV